MDKKEVLRDEKGRLLKGTGLLNPAGKRGIRHKATKVKEAFFTVFEKVGGVKELVRWVNASPANKRDFYKMVVGLLPREIDLHSQHEELKLIIVRPEGAFKDEIIDGETIIREPATITVNKKGREEDEKSGDLCKGKHEGAAPGESTHKT